jgi:hypothetical protein
MNRIVFILLMLAGFVAKSQNPYIGRYIRFVTVDTTLLSFPAGTGGFYYNNTTGYMMVKDATGYHKITPGLVGGGGGGTIVGVNGTTNRIDATGTTTRTLDISATFEALLGKVASPLSQFSATTSAQLRGVLSDESGPGVAFFQGGNIGTISGGVLTNATGLPISTGVSGLGTGVAAFLADPTGQNLGTAVTNESGTGVPVYTIGASLVNTNLGTPASGIMTNVTGLPITGITSSTSAQLATLLSDEEGAGVLYFGQPTGANTTFAGDHTLATTDVGINLSGIVVITGASPSTLTVPTNATAAITVNSLIAVWNQSSDTITVAFAGGVTPIWDGNAEIPPYAVGSFRKQATNTWAYIGPGSGGGGGLTSCKMVAEEFTTTKTLDLDDIASCNNTGFLTYTGTSDVNLTVPVFATEAFAKGSNIAISNQSVDDDITIVFTGGVSGGGHTYTIIGPGETGFLIWRDVDVVDLLGVQSPTEDLVASATLDFGSVVAGAIADLTVTVTGAVVGDIVAIGVSTIPNKGTYFGWVSSANTVTVRYANNDLTTAKDPSSQTVKVRVFK